MATKYYVDLSVADQEEHVRVGLVGSLPKLADAYVEGCRILLERGAAGADQPIWYAVAKEEDGKERDLTSTEMGALAAAFEQEFPDIEVRFPSREFPDIKIRFPSPEERRVKRGMDLRSMSIRIGLWLIGAIAALFVLYVLAQLLITPG